MRKQKWYEISDINEFIKSLRLIVLNEFFEDKEKNIFSELFEAKKEELERKLSLEETYSIIKPLATKNKKPYGDDYLISHKTFTEMIDSLNRRIISNLLLELTLSGDIESAFDDEKNDFIFWIKEDQCK